MDVNTYAGMILAEARLAELREAAQRQHVAQAARTPRPIRVTLGHALIRLGQRLLGGLTPARASA
jgi:hypothetical protein